MPTSRTVAGHAAADQAQMPLSTNDMAELLTAIETLRIEIRSFLSALPVEGQSASGLARLLRVERTTCQRLVFSAMQPAGDVKLAAALPGVQGLRMVITRATTVFSRQAGLRDVARQLSAAVDAYERLIRRLAGSRARLLSRLAAPGSRAMSDRAATDPTSAREQLFEAAAELSGRQSDQWLAVHLYEPTANPDRLVQTRAHGLLGHVARPDAVPLTFHAFATAPPSAEKNDDLGRFLPLAPAADDDVPAEVLRQFTSDPPPVVRSKQPQEFLVQTLDRQPSAAAEPFDIVFGMTGVMAHPGRYAPFLEEVWALVNFPVRRLLLDVYLHREIARGCIPGLDVHLWRPDFASQAGERWQTRFPTGPTLQVLGASPQPPAAYPRYGELLDTLLQARGATRQQFVGYRCEVEFPMWRTGYRMTFDFGAEGG